MSYWYGFIAMFTVLPIHQVGFAKTSLVDQASLVPMSRVRQALRRWLGSPGSGPGYAGWRPMKAM